MTNLRTLPGGRQPDRVRRAAEALAAEMDDDTEVTGVAIVVIRKDAPCLRSFDYDNCAGMMAELFSAAVDLHNKRGPFT